MEGIYTADLFDLSHTSAAEYLKRFKYPWEALPGLKAYIAQLCKILSNDEYAEVSEGVWAHNTAKIAPTAYICAPCIIGADTQVRHCAYIRGGVLVGKNCVVGNSTELKNAILFDNVQVPHYNYVGDSILGYMAHMGAGAITSNVKADRCAVAVKSGEESIETGLKKFGAMIGDGVEIGCNGVLNPGTVIGRGSRVYPLTSVRGVIPQGSIVKGGKAAVLRGRL